jgi:hypothetical protein
MQLVTNKATTAIDVQPNHFSCRLIFVFSLLRLIMGQLDIAEIHFDRGISSDGTSRTKQRRIEKLPLADLLTIAQDLTPYTAPTERG